MGTIPLAQLPAALLTDGANGVTVTGTFTGDGGALTNLDGASLTGSVLSPSLTSVAAGSLTGTVADARLSANVAWRAGGNTLTGNKIFNSGNVGIGQAAPGLPLNFANVLGDKIALYGN